MWVNDVETKGAARHFVPGLESGMTSFLSSLKRERDFVNFSMNVFDRPTFLAVS